MPDPSSPAPRSSPPPSTPANAPAGKEAAEAPRGSTLIRFAPLLAVALGILSAVLLVSTLVFWNQVGNRDNTLEQGANRLVQLQAAAEELQAQVTLDKTSIERMGKRVDAAKAESAVRQADLDKITLADVDLQTNLEKARASATDFQTQMEDARVASIKRQGDVDVAKAQNEVLRTQLSQAQSDVNQLQAQLVKARADAADLAEQLAKAQKPSPRSKS